MTRKEMKNFCRENEIFCSFSSGSINHMIQNKILSIIDNLVNYEVISGDSEKFKKFSAIRQNFLNLTK